jgi:hypothetical protein
MSDLSIDTKKHTTKSRETIPLKRYSHKIGEAYLWFGWINLKLTVFPNHIYLILKFCFRIKLLKMASVRVRLGLDYSQEQDFPLSKLLLRGSITPEERHSGPAISAK